uniref:Uncharacterized protein n=1 Tax=Cacopsylla melanoneura TaxID=428564 RepID=A0A8D9ERY5_9HEMI
MGAVILSASLPMSNLCLPKLLFSFPLTVFCDTIFLTSLSTYINCMYLRFYFTLNPTYLSYLCYLILPIYLLFFVCSSLILSFVLCTYLSFTSVLYVLIFDKIDINLTLCLTEQILTCFLPGQAKSV